MVKVNKKVTSRVSRILEDYPETRNSDRKLYLTYLKDFHQLREHIDTKGFLGLVEVFMNAETPPMESISRARRKIQEQGFYLSDEQTKQGRLDKAEHYRQGTYY